MRRFLTKCVYYFLLPFFTIYYLLRPTPQQRQPVKPPSFQFVVGEVISTPDGPMRVLGVDEAGLVWCCRVLSPELARHFTTTSIFFMDGITAAENRTGVVLEDTAERN